MRNGFFLLLIMMTMSCGLTDVLDCYDGTHVRKELNLANFHKIDIDFPCEIVLQKGNVQKITIEGMDDMIKDLEHRSSVSNDTWKARTRNNCISRSKDTRIIMTIPDLSEIKIDGNGRIDTEYGLDNTAPNLKIDIDGSANVLLDIVTLETLDIIIDGSAKTNLKGKAQTLTIKVDGSATINGHQFITKKSTVNIDGNATVNINTQDLLNVTIDGSGTVCYLGNPSVTSKIDGSGRLKNCN